MKVILLLVFLSVSVALIFLIGFFWAIKNGQYEDEVTPAIRMLFDNTLSHSTQNANDDENE